MRLLQLSDIHFRPENDPSRDVNLAVRRDLLNDIRRMGAAVAPCDAVLVVGDIAAGGREEEYALAEEFLEEVCNLVECPYEHIFCVPGNHDVDRSQHSAMNNSLRNTLRTATPGEVHKRLEEMYSHPGATAALHAPFANYNRFARTLNCEVSAAAPVPTPWDLPFAGTTLRIHGVNSALVCDANDSDKKDEYKVVLGMNQLAGCQSDDGVVSLLMCHHPMEWLRDRDVVEPLLRRPHLLLTGHVHEFGLRQDADTGSLTIACGAVNPDAGFPGWFPAYNVIDLNVKAQELVVSVRVRTYGRTARFGPEQGRPDPDVYRIPFEVDAQPPTPELTTPIAPSPSTPRPAGTNDRDMIFDILQADKDARLRAAVGLKLVDPTFSLATDDDESRLAFAIRESDRLKEMHEAVIRESSRG